MRQAGLIAAAGIYALENHVERLAQDHERARALAEALASLPDVVVESAPETNMVLIDVPDVADHVRGLAEHGVDVGAVSRQTLRAVTHMNVDDDGIRRAIEAFAAVAGARET